MGCGPSTPVPEPVNTTTATTTTAAASVKAEEPKATPPPPTTTAAVPAAVAVVGEDSTTTVSQAPVQQPAAKKLDVPAPATPPVNDLKTKVKPAVVETAKSIPQPVTTTSQAPKLDADGKTKSQKKNQKKREKAKLKKMDSTTSQ
jgi:hypothetical protein